MSNYSVVKQSEEQGHNVMRAALFNAAGISFERQAKLLQKAINKLESKLDAKHTEIVSYQGEVTEQIELEDNAAQLRASEALIDVLGAKPSKSTGDAQGDVIVQIVFPQACQPTAAMDVTPVSSLESAKAHYVACDNDNSKAHETP